jgi:Fur family peroxide stress response transcriptional regulator
MDRLSEHVGTSGITKQREAVLRVIREHDQHLTANEVFGHAKKLLPGISFATVYNSLRYLKNEGFIGEVRVASDAARFDRKLERHDHALCSKCGKLVDIDLPSPKALLKKAAELSHFDAESVEIILRGTCPDCKNKS